MQPHFSELSPQEAYWYFFSQSDRSELIALAKQDWKDTYFILLRVWTRLIGTSPEALHLFPISLHIASTVLLYALLTKWLSKSIVLPITVLYLTNPYSWIMVYTNPRALFAGLILWLFAWGISKCIPKKKKRQRMVLSRFKVPFIISALVLLFIYAQQIQTRFSVMPRYALSELKTYLEANLRGDDGVVLQTSDSYLPYLFDYYSIDYYRTPQELPKKIYRVAVISQAGVAAPTITGYTKTDEYSIHQLTITWHQKAPSQTP